MEPLKYDSGYKALHCDRSIKDLSDFWKVFEDIEKKERTMKQMFFKEDVGGPVTFVRGRKKIKCVISEWNEDNDNYPVIVEVPSGVETFTCEGKVASYDKHRSLYHGHNINIQITGEEVPERYVDAWVNLYDGPCGIHGVKFATKEDAEYHVHGEVLSPPVKVKIPSKNSFPGIDIIKDATEGRR